MEVEGGKNEWKEQDNVDKKGVKEINGRRRESIGVEGERGKQRERERGRGRRREIGKNGWMERTKERKV